MAIKLCWQMIVFNSDEVLELCLKSIVPYGPIMITEGPVEYFWKRGFMTSGDHTNDILRKYVPRENVLHGRWKEKDEMMNAAVHLIPEDTTHVWMVDADEIWKPEDIEHVTKLLESYDSVAFKPWSFYGGFERYMSGFEENFSWQRIQRWAPGAAWQTHRPPTVLLPEDKRLGTWRHLSETRTAEMGIRFYHYSYVFPEQIKRKTEYYHERDPRGTIANYFRQVYLPWALGDAATRDAIETVYQGVHDWLPARRGECFTRKFEGEHPAAIQEAMPKLQQRFERELERYRR